MNARPVTTKEQARVREMWAAGARDVEIAAELRRNPRVVGSIRARLGLQSMYGRGRPRNDERRAR
jgi:predicted nuclease of predicted toxin-antitoxin system